MLKFYTQCKGIVGKGSSIYRFSKKSISFDDFFVGHQHGLGSRANVLPLVPDALWNQALTFSRNNSQGKTDIKSINIPPIILSTQNDL